MKLQSASVNMAELDKLAKLLATENITITHKGTKTAYFDVQQRELVLPVWDNLTKELYHMLVLHEVGHALYTNAGEWEAALRAEPKLKNAANVIEDARIERLMKVKYPGARRDFRMGYEQLLDRDFFQIGQRDVNRMSLGDRLNLHYKIGESVPIHFTPQERMFVTAIDSAKTFRDVVRIARELMSYMGDKTVSEDFSHDFKQAANEQDGDDDADWDEDSDSEDGEYSDSDDDDWGDDSGWGDEDEDEDGQDSDGEGDDADGGDEESDGAGDEEGEEGNSASTPTDEEGKDKRENKTPSNRGHGRGDDEITTNQALEQALEQMAAGNASRAPLYYETFDDFESERWIVPYKQLLEAIRKNYPDQLTGDHYRLMRKANIKVVDYLAKEFFIRKAADGYQRAKESKTGIINPDKLHSYKMVDDIFRRNSVVADSKSHGLVMFIDFSGSMSYQMKRTVEQLFNLVMFCRKVNIPHRVFAFTDACQSYVSATRSAQGSYYSTSLRVYTDQKAKQAIIDSRQKYLENKIGQCSGSQFLVPEANMNLLELFNESMSTRDLRDMMEALLGNFSQIAYLSDPKSIAYFALGGTPLDASVLLGADIARRFRKETSTQLVSVVLLTDGDSSGCGSANFKTQSVYPMKLDGTIDYNGEIVKKRITTFINVSASAPVTTSIRDYRTKKLYRLGESTSASFSITTGLLGWIKSLGFTTIGYRVDGEYAMKQILRWKKIGTEPEKVEYMQAIKKNKCVSIPNVFGFDLWNGIVQDARIRYNTQNLAQHEEDEDEGDFHFNVDKNATKGQITKAFIAARRERLNLRSVLQGFIKKIAA